MTPQEYVDRERHRAYMNLKRANERGDQKAAERKARAEARKKLRAAKAQQNAEKQRDEDVFEEGKP